MFRRTKRKIVAAVMSGLALLFLGTLAVIYGSSYREVVEDSYAMLERHAQLYVLLDHAAAPDYPELPNGGMEPFPDDRAGGKMAENTPSFQLSTFYSVAVSPEGAVLAVDIGDRELYDGETLVSCAQDVLEGGRDRGVKDSLIYLVKQKNGYTLVAFMDNTVTRQSMTTLFRYTLVFGSVAMVVLFFVAIFLAERIVRPLEESYRKQKQFISDAGHELKTPVSVVSANAEMLGRELGDNQWLSNIQYENERMGRLVTQLLELARTENVKPQRQRVDLSRLVAGGVLPFESVAYEKGTAICTDIAENVAVSGDPGQLCQLVSILVDNAIRHGTGGREISVTLRENRSHAVLAVTNSGEAIPPETAARLFERFYRVDEARTGEDRHYGLGLSIARAITDAHRGRIEVSCQDGLVTFRVSLPKG